MEIQIKFEDGYYIGYYNGEELAKGKVLSKVVNKMYKYLKGQGL